MELVIRNWAERIFIFLFSSIFLIDSLNGFLLNNSINLFVSLGQGYRLGTYLFLATMIVYKNRINNLKLFLIINFVLFALLLYYGYYYLTPQGIGFDILVVAKLLLPLYIVEAFRNMLRQNLATRNTLDKVLLYNMILIPISILLPKFIGMGFSVYRGGAGFKGFYFANNDLNIVLLVLFTYALFSLFTKVHSYKVIISGVLMTFTSLMLIGSKSSLGFGLLIILAFVYAYFRESRVNLKFTIKKQTAFLITLGMVFLLGSSIYLRNEVSSIFARQLYNLANQSFVTYIFSSRDKFLLAAIDSFLDSQNMFLEFLFGTGMYYRQVLTAKFLGWGFTTAKGIEMDFFDILFSYGILVTMSIYIFYFKIFIKAIRKMKNGHINKKFAVIGFVIIMLFSSLAGHVLYSALAGTFFALVCCFLITEYEGGYKHEKEYSSSI